MTGSADPLAYRPFALCRLQGASIGYVALSLIGVKGRESRGPERERRMLCDGQLLCIALCMGENKQYYKTGIPHSIEIVFYSRCS